MKKISLQILLAIPTLQKWDDHSDGVRHLPASGKRSTGSQCSVHLEGTYSVIDSAALANPWHFTFLAVWGPTTLLTLYTMCQKILQMQEKSCALALLEKGESAIAVAKDLGVSREAIHQLKQLAASLPPRMVPQTKSGSDIPKKTMPRTDKLLKREVPSHPMITTVELKNWRPSLLQKLQPGQFAIACRRTLVYQVAELQPCSQQQWRRSSTCAISITIGNQNNVRK